MKIGILTYHAACNFGANLQVLSTYSYLKNHGHQPIIIDWFTEELQNHYHNQTPNDQEVAHVRFRQRHFEMTKRCFEAKDIAEEICRLHIEAVIVGSDAVAQHHPFWERLVFPCRKIFAVRHMTQDRIFPNPYWGTFQDYLEKPVPIAIMSASNQNSSFRKMTRTEKKQMQKRINSFKYISARDKWTSEMYEYISDGEIRPLITPDPVFAFNQNVDFIPSESEIRARFNLPKKYYLLSFHHSNTVSREWLLEFKELALKEDIECVALPFPAGVKYNHPFDKQINIPLDPLDWYALLKYSNGFVGHNMHPIVICLHNHVPCFSFDHYGITKYKFWVNEKSSKIYHIMDRFGVGANRICCIKRNQVIPSAQHVIDKLKCFNANLVMTFAEDYLGEYNSMMYNIIQSIS